MKLLPCLLAAALGLIAGAAKAAGFDCAKAASRAERMVCDAPELSAMDEGLAKLYAAALGGRDAARTREEQRAWLAERDNATDTEDLKERYAWRIGELAGASVGRGYRRPGRWDPGYMRLIPVGGGWTVFLLSATHEMRGGPPGSVNEGESAGAFHLSGGKAAWSHHACRLDFRRLSAARWVITSSRGCFGEGAQWGWNVNMSGTYSATR